MPKAIGLAGLLFLAACGQKGALFLPRDSAAANRATLPQAIRSTLPGGTRGKPAPAEALPAAPTGVMPPTPQPDAESPPESSLSFPQ